MGGGGGGRGGGGAEPGQAGCGDKRHGVRRGAEETLVPLLAPSWSFRWLHPRWEREGGREEAAVVGAELARPPQPPSRTLPALRGEPGARLAPSPGRRPSAASSSGQAGGGGRSR